MSKITDAIKKIEKKRIELFNACTELENLIIYSHFEGDKPFATISNDGEVFLNYNDKELHKDDIIYLMKEQGYITPYDFY